MPRCPVDAPKRRVIKTLESLGFRMVREKEHISMIGHNPVDPPQSPQDKRINPQSNLHPGGNSKRRIHADF
jgi:hypothetical protein